MNSVFRTRNSRPEDSVENFGRRQKACGLVAVIAFALSGTPSEAQDRGRPKKIPPVPKPVQKTRQAFHAELLLVSPFIHDVEARSEFAVDGAGLTVAVLDTGLRTTHVDFTGINRIPSRRNFTGDNGGNADDVADGQGHGTNVGGIIVAHQDHVGIAPGANIVPLKVLTNDGGGDFDAIDRALQWVIENHSQFNITTVNMSLGDQSNRADDSDLAADSIKAKIKALRDAKVAVVVAAGNDWFRFNGTDKPGPVQQGMAYPAIIRETVSVGAVFDSNIGSIAFVDGAAASSTAAGLFTPFSQRLNETVSPACRTDILAPGAPVTSSGIDSDHGESVESGTSQASPVTAGLVLLMQQYHLRATGELPAVDDLETWLRLSGVPHRDGDGEDDDVKHTNDTFLRLDARSALAAVKRQLQIQTLVEQGRVTRRRAQ